MKCHYCEKTNDLRPYGPRGAMVCFNCAMSTPERKAEAEQNFAIQLAYCGNVPVVIGEEVGPYPHQYAAKVRQGEQSGTWLKDSNVNGGKRQGGEK